MPPGPGGFVVGLEHGLKIEGPRRAHGIAQRILGQDDPDARRLAMIPFGAGARRSDVAGNKAIEVQNETSSSPILAFRSRRCCAAGSIAFCCSWRHLVARRGEIGGR
jgi:hypothetical protein